MSEKRQKASDAKSGHAGGFDLRTKAGRAAFIDATWDRALEVIRSTGRASPAHFQRQLCISYGSAMRLMDELERRGVIGPKRPGWPTREILTERISR